MTVDPLLSLFAHETEATPVDLTRLRARVRAAESKSAASSVMSWLGLPGTLAVGGLLAAAATAIVVLPGMSAPDPLALSFADGAAAGVEVAPGVVMTADGAGELSGTETAPRLAWASGAVDISVEPGAGLDVQVATDEATVRVVGTVFRVERDALGTTVSVSRGKVAVECVDQDERFVPAEQSITCLPTSAAGLLGRAQALPPGTEAVLAAVEAGLASAPDSAIQTELSALRVDHLAHTQQFDAAIAAAERHLAVPEMGRRAEVARIGATLAYQRDACGSVSPFLSELPDEELAASALSACQDRNATGE